ncbi:uncharacterized protein LOC117118431 [Anneissia japonica]|uniref:uncharacterized protein LOC117118431 n=1 Tax=Anneissia japonica TaxID=1529436 RepID=UPI0014258E49|nr:uncharacterized protein LOC117118431 [Anneissia japonica]
MADGLKIPGTDYVIMYAPGYQFLRQLNIIDLDKEARQTLNSVKRYKPSTTLEIGERPLAEDLPKELYIAVFGGVGSGKSCLINSLKYVLGYDLKRPYEDITGERTGVCSTTDGGKTRGFLKVFLTDQIAVFDNRGMPDFDEATVAVVATQLRGLRENSDNVNWNRNVVEKIFDAKEMALKDTKDCQIHIALLVVSASDRTLRVKEMEDFAKRIKIATSEFPIAVITHIDEAKEHRVEEIVSDLEDIGIQFIFPMRNYTIRDHDVDPETHKVMLNLLQCCTRQGDKVMKNRPEAECRIL